MDAKIKARVINVVKRYLWSRWEEKGEVLKRCKIKEDIGHYKNGNIKTKVRYKCEKCSVVVDSVEVDHIEPAIDTAKGWEGFDVYLSRLLVGADKLQALCIPCHQAKSSKENAKRKEGKTVKD